jgi:hypothetical protein
MRILLDECTDQSLRHSFPDHDCQTARYAGLSGLKNGALLSAAEAANFNVLLTVDKSIEFQQNLASRKIAVIVLSGESDRLRDLLPLIPACLATLDSIQPGQLIKIGV